MATIDVGSEVLDMRLKHHLAIQAFAMPYVFYVFWVGSWFIGWIVALPISLPYMLASESQDKLTVFFISLVIYNIPPLLFIYTPRRGIFRKQIEWFDSNSDALWNSCVAQSAILFLIACSISLMVA